MNVERRILEEISGGGFRSGEAISERLGISRSAVWKHIGKLRRQGYEIEASPRHGYRLLGRPDKLLPAELEPLLDTEVVGRNIVHFEETGSTAVEARALIEKGAPGGTVVIAESQTAGRGRMGRSWETSPSQSIAMSVIFRSGIPPTLTPLFSLATAVATAQAVAATVPVRPAVKWPNDVYLDGRKLAGVLVEMAAELDRVRWLIDSVGVNVNNSFTGSDLRGRAVSLAEVVGGKVSRVAVATAILAELDRLWLQARRGDLSRYRRLFGDLDLLRGKRIVVREGDQQLAGVAEGIDGDGRLLLRLDSGEVRTLFGGEATLAA